jgi:hypothetical protein
MRVLPALALALTALALPALALPALAAGDNVVMIAVAHVAVPHKLPGLCLVSGLVNHVWEGHTFHEGQLLSLNVPCGTHDGVMPLLPATPGGARLTDPVVLRASKLGAAHLDDAGNLMWQPASGSRDVIWGYRVLQGVRLRLGHNA